MKGMGIQRRVRFGKGLKRSQSAKSIKDSKRVPRITRILALAYHIEELVESGKVKNYAEVGRIFGVTRSRITQVRNLLNLSARIQESILLGELDMSELRLQEIGRDPNWEHQRL